MLNLSGFAESFAMPDQSLTSQGQQQHPNRVFRSPRRVTITLPYNVYEHLLAKSDEEGRSLSNLAAFALESSLSKLKEIQERMW